MMIDLRNETLVELGKARDLLPGRPDRATLYRWALGPGSHGVHLETLKVGRTRYTSREALQRFAEAVTAAADGQAPPALRTSRAKQKAMRAAERRLADAGI